MARRSNLPRKSKLRGKLARLDARTKAYDEDKKDRSLDYGGIRDMANPPGSMQ
jgi:hypothetical protein